MAITKKTAKKKVAPQDSKLGAVPLHNITDHPEMGDIYRPIDKAWVSDLATSIVDGGGLDTPLIVATVEGSKVHHVIAGRHRRNALIQIKKRDPRAFDRLFSDGIPATIRDGKDFTGAVCAHLRENVKRKSVAPEEIFPALNFLLAQEGLKQKDVARRLGKSEGWVSQMLTINEDLPEDLKKAVLDKSLPARKGQELARELRKAEEGDTAAKAAAEAKVQKARDSIAKKKAATKSNAPVVKRHSLKTLYQVFHRISNVSIGRKNQILEGIIQYALTDSDEVPAEIQVVFKEDEQDKVKAAKEQEAAKKQAKAERNARRKAKLAEVAERRRAEKKAAKKTVKKIAKKAPKKLAKKVVKKTAKKTVKKRPVKKVAKKSAKKS